MAPWRIGFALARKLKAAYPNADPNDLLPRVRTELPGATEAEIEVVGTEFVGAWARVKYPEGSGPLDDAYRAAMDCPLPKAAQVLNSQAARKLWALCEQLGRKGQFPLSQTAVARVMGVRQTDVSRWLRYFRDHGWIRMVVEANRGLRRAAEYELAGERGATP